MISLATIGASLKSLKEGVSTLFRRKEISNQEISNQKISDREELREQSHLISTKRELNSSEEQFYRLKELEDAFSDPRMTAQALGERLRSSINKELQAITNLVNQANGSFSNLIEARENSRKLAFSFLTKLKDLMRGLDLERSPNLQETLDLSQYQYLTRIAVSGAINPQGISFNPPPVEQINLARAISDTEQLSDGALVDRCISSPLVNYCNSFIHTCFGAASPEALSDASFKELAALLISSLNTADYMRMFANIKGKPPSLLRSISEPFNSCLRLRTSFQEELMKVQRLNDAIGLSPDVLNPIKADFNKLNTLVETTLGRLTLPKNKELNLPALKAPTETFLTQSTRLREMRRAAVKTALHALIMAYNGKFEENPYYASNEPAWQRNFYNRILNDFRISLTNPSSQEASKQELIRIIARAANELANSSREAFDIQGFAEARNFKKELELLLTNALNQKKPENIWIAVRLLSTLFASSAEDTQKLFKTSNPDEAPAMFWSLKYLFQSPFREMSFNEGEPHKFDPSKFIDICMNGTKTGEEGKFPTIVVLYQFIAAALQHQKETQGIETTSSTLYGLYLYRFVLEHLKVENSDPNSLHWMRSFSKLAFNPSTRALLRKELPLNIPAREARIALHQDILRLHQERVNEVAKGLEQAILEILRSEATAESQNSLQILAEEYIKLEHDMRSGLASDEAEIGKANSSKAYHCLGLPALIPQIYDWNPESAIVLQEFYARDKGHREVPVYKQSYLERIGEALSKHLIPRIQSYKIPRILDFRNSACFEELKTLIALHKDLNYLGQIIPEQIQGFINQTHLDETLSSLQILQPAGIPAPPDIKEALATLQRLGKRLQRFCNSASTSNPAPKMLNPMQALHSA